MKKRNECKFCCNAFSDSRLDQHYDSSSVAVGISDRKYTAFVSSSSSSSPPVSITVSKFSDVDHQNHDVAFIPLRYCPMCGRRIIENDGFFENEKSYK